MPPALTADGERDQVNTSPRNLMDFTASATYDVRALSILPSSTASRSSVDAIAEEMPSPLRSCLLLSHGPRQISLAIPCSTLPSLEYVMTLYHLSGESQRARLQPFASGAAGEFGVLLESMLGCRSGCPELGESDKG
jgi:hypothetical protein